MPVVLMVCQLAYLATYLVLLWLVCNCLLQLLCLCYYTQLDVNTISPSLLEYKRTDTLI